jgi:hypothetical protein
MTPSPRLRAMEMQLKLGMGNKRSMKLFIKINLKNAQVFIHIIAIPTYK